MLNNVPIFGDTILTTKAQVVGKGVPVSDLVKTMHQAQAALRHPCIAAKHVGVNVAIVTIDTRFDKNSVNAVHLVQTLVNPQIITALNPLLPGLESDPSIPDYQGSVERHSTVTVSFLDEKLNPTEHTFSDTAARWVLHGIELLDGKLFIDNLNAHRLRSIRGHLARVASKNQAP